MLSSLGWCRSSLLRCAVVSLALGCAAPAPEVRSDGAGRVPAGRTRKSADGGCTVKSRTLSAAGRSSVRPSLAAGPDGYAVVWEESGEDHRGVHFQAVDPDAAPLGASVEVADLERGGAEPRVVPDGDGYAVFWTIDQPDTSTIAFRRVDRLGRPRGDIVASVSAPSARALSAVRVEGGFVLVWWTWATTPHVQKATWLDGNGRARGPSVEITRAPSVDPTVDLRPPAAIGEEARAGLVAAWEELVDGIDHIIIGDLTSKELAQRTDLGAGDTPSLGLRTVFFERTADESVWSAPLAPCAKAADGTASCPSPVAARFATGQTPDAAPSRDGAVLCLVRPAAGESDATSDELHCFELIAGRLERDQLLESAPRGILFVQVASSATLGRYAVVYQTEEPSGMTIGLSSVTCRP